MAQPSQPSDPITLVISEVVKPDQIQAYEHWVRGISQAARQFDGYLGVDVIRPRDHAHPEYVVVVKFDNYTHFKAWQTSTTYYQWVEKSRDLLVSRSLQQKPSGLELWFTLPQGASQPVSQPAYYKKVILGTVAVYPLILVTDTVLKPFLQNLPPLLALLISVTVLSALLTYPVMPWLTHLLEFWLYPSSSKKRKSRSSGRTSTPSL